MAIDLTHESYQYDTLFYEYQRKGAARSARALLPHVLAALRVGSVLDVGCGAGGWLAAYRELEVADCIGVDGDYVDRAMLLIEPKAFLPRDIGLPFDLGRQFDLVQCLEVGEHVPTSASATLVDNLVRHGKVILFSAAVPGQGGKQHINEQPYSFWRALFAARGYRLFDFVRPRIANDGRIEPWYRYNVLFYCCEDAIPELPPDIASTRVPDTEPVPDYAPTSYRLRRAVLRALPPRAVSTLAVMKHKWLVRSRRWR